ncbi:MAG: DNA polymerase I [Bacteroidales bacterium]|nr:DNA polymerase I [Bacteroidales bacterium]MCM1415237.1 DNA polymerase I [bacterium]MCM1423769.1 DNA polymerase I [bacterium]
MAEKLVLIDGHSILNRAFYGVPDLTNGQGLHTNAIYGFLNIMFKILEEEQADYLTVAFDVHAPTFRHEIYKDYKGTRKPMPTELREQVPVMKELLLAMGICVVEQAGLEADDILGTIARRGEKEGMEVSLVSGDRDLLQIATDHIRIRIPKTKGGRTEVEDYYAKDVEAAYQVTPAQFIDLKALMGDTADNIPGVPKVGEKTATELMTTYGSLENIYAHVEEISKKAIRESLIGHRDLADLSKVLATINVEAPIAFSFADAKIGNFYTEEAYVLCKQLEFKNILSRFSKDVEVVNEQASHFRTVTDFSEAEAVFQACGEREKIGFFAFLDDGTPKSCMGLALALSEEETVFLPCQGGVTAEWLKERLTALHRNKLCKLITFNLKGQYGILGEPDECLWRTADGGQDVMRPYRERRYFDILVAAYLLNPLKSDYLPEDIAGERLSLTIPDRTQVCGKASYSEAYQKTPAEFAQYACYQAYVAFAAAPVLTKMLEEQGMESLFYDIEMPLTKVLYDMERYGVLVQPEQLKAYGAALIGRIAELIGKIYEQAGCEFNINSPKQLGEILFEKMGIPGGKKTKTGYSTAADVLEKLAPDHPIVSDILEYRGLAKLKSTYAEGLFACIAADGRIHSTFNQTITATGRISSTEPNLQNIPMRMELGRQIRKVFVPKEGCLFMDADYSQIELRILAHMSDDKQLIEAYRMEEDIHRITASKVFHTPFAEVTDLQRRNAKAVNFGIVYGISSFGLSQDLSISKKEAADYIEQYFETYPGVKRFLDHMVETAKTQGFVTTMYCRRRPIPELKSNNFMQRSFGERVAMNSPIQGTAADIMKIAMIRVWERLHRENLKSRLILQVHDELLIETEKTEEEAVRRILTEEMQQAADLSVRLEIDLHTGTDWYEAK